jgi:homoserine kinase type II
MAVYTHIELEALARFLEDYPLGPALSFKGIAEGVENSNYLLDTEQGRFILTLYEKRVHKEDLPFFLGLLEHLSARGLPCPLPVKRKDGSPISTLHGRPAALVTFLEGVSVTRPTSEQCRAVGAALADLHRLGADYTRRRDNAMGPAGWQAIAAQIGARADSVSAGLAALIDEELAFLAARWPKDLPAGVIHADLFPDNVFFIGRRLSGLIDFYFACNDLYAYDFAITLNAWCFEGRSELNITKARALAAGYRSKREFSAAEIAALPALARGAALRFLLTRTIDWIDQAEGALVKPKDPIDYLARLRFHRAVTSASDYGFDV